jgi:hypothetical protein
MPSSACLSCNFASRSPGRFHGAGGGAARRLRADRGLRRGWPVERAAWPGQVGAQPCLRADVSRRIGRRRADRLGRLGQACMAGRGNRAPAT